jgi:hypothetical protein
MTLVIKKPKGWRSRQVGVAIWVIGALTLLVAPFSLAINVRSPETQQKDTPITTVLSGKLGTSGSSLAVSKTNAVAQPVSSSLSQSNTSTDCKSSTAAPSGLLNAASSELRKLAQYDQVCASGIVNTLSFFTPIPTTAAQAQSYSSDVIAQLKEFAVHGISALVFLEPTTEQGGLIDMNTYNSGAYDAMLDAYFSAIRASGITDSMMGTWVPFPEGNIPVWTSVDPTVFTSSVVKTVTYQKKYFPSSKASILLDSMTYPSVSTWSNGTQVSLLPYVQNMPTGLLDSFGLQGFPWVPPANQPGWATNGEPQNYLRVDLAAQAARNLNVNKIWLNTGTFSMSYAGKAGEQVVVTPARRQQLLLETITQLQTLQKQGFQVSLHLFAQDKSTVNEAINWSYWPTGQASLSQYTSVFKSFVHELQANNIPLWLFDTDS